MAILNENPRIHQISSFRESLPSDYDDKIIDEWDTQEIYDIIRDINDPEHPLTLAQLNVIQKEHIYIRYLHNISVIRVDFTPTIPHCSMATIIGLSIRVKLMRSLPGRFKIDVFIKEGTHQSEEAINKQLNDKERVAAALENPNLLEVINQCLANK
jgi:metal-sulfur cluster biosynthetic enzyme